MFLLLGCGLLDYYGSMSPPTADMTRIATSESQSPAACFESPGITSEDEAQRQHLKRNSGVALDGTIEGRTYKAARTSLSPTANVARVTSTATLSKSL